MALGDGLDNAACDGFRRHLARRPMTDGAPGRLGGLTGQRDDLTPLLGTQGGGSARPLGVLEALEHRTVLTLEPVSSPSPDRLAGGAQVARHRWGVESFGQS